ncbi:MAG: FAD-dependent oxidoreductase, partial [Gemmatimonadota bacterium]|nr:FAD-dependent oxidoreductase [Gemmatimonadota bacterium]
MKTDVVIVGAGVIGLSIAYELLCRGTRVTLVDPGNPGKEASWAAAGVLAPQGARPVNRAYLDLCLSGLDQYADWSAALFGETGIDIEYRTEAGLQVAFDDAESEELDQRYRHQQDLGLPVEQLTGEEVRALEPMLSPETRCGLLFERMHQVENRRLVQALVAAVRARGGLFRIGDPVIDLIVRRNRAAGVVVPGGRIGAERVVVAAGAWSGLLKWIPGPSPPVQPVRGQMVCIDGRAVPPLGRVVYGLELYLVPRRDGRVLMGATVEKTGFDASVTAGG